MESGLFDVKLVVTQPDKPTGRHQEIQRPPVKLLSEKNNLPVAQPESLRDNIKILKYYNIDLNIVVEYGLMIPPEIINAPKLGTINIHPSLLPKYRGASPIQSALWNGDTVTGTTIMLIDEKMDHGPLLAQEEIAIEPADDYFSLAEKLADLSARLLLKTVPQFAEGKIFPRPQDDAAATSCRELKRADGLIDWKKSAPEIYNQYRALVAWPGIYALWNGKRLKFLTIALAEKKSAPGLVQIVDKKMFIGCGQGAIEILEIQPEGKKAMTASAFANGNAGIDRMKLTE